MKIQAATVSTAAEQMPIWVPAACGLSVLATFSSVLALDGLAASASGSFLWMPALTPVFLLSYWSGFKGAMQGFGLGIHSLWAAWASVAVRGRSGLRRRSRSVSRPRWDSPRWVRVGWHDAFGVTGRRSKSSR